MKNMIMELNEEGFITTIKAVIEDYAEYNKCSAVELAEKLKGELKK